LNISSFPSSLISLDEKGNPLVDSDGNKIYNGDVERGRRLDIVIGLPASGKSSAIVDTISYEHHSMLIDNDEAKRQFPEFNKGWGANTVHKESQIVEQAVFREALREGRNIVLPKVGSDADKLMTDYIAYAKDAGYKVNVHFVDLDRNKALGRMMGRFIHTGRYLSPELINKYANERDGNKIAQAYEALKSMDGIDGCSKWDNDVGRGEKPILLEAANLDDDFIKNARLKGDMENEERKHGQFTRGSEDDLCISGDSAGDRGADAQSGSGDKRADGRDGEHDTGRAVSVPEGDLRQVSGVSHPELFDENISEVHEVSKSQQDDYAEVARTYQCLHMDEDENAFNVCLFKDDDGKNISTSKIPQVIL
jgi:predicted ABC-type ATPase